MLRLGLLGGPLDASHHADELDAETGLPVEVQHLQSSFILEGLLRAELGLIASDTLGLAVGLEVPLRMFDTTIRYVDDQGHDVPIAGDDVHHRNETLVGLGDPLLELRGAWTLDQWTLEARLGLRLPVGRTEPDPFAAGTAGVAHQHFQFGTGTFDPLIALSVAHAMDDVTLALWAETRQVLYQNGHGFQAGDRYAVGLTAISSLGVADVRFIVGADLQHEAAERWNGVVPSDDGNRGRTDVLGAFGVVWSPSDANWLGLTARVPFYTHVVGGQLDYPLLIELAVGGTLDLRAKVDAKGKDQDAPKSPPEDPARPTITDITDIADIADIGPAGSAAALVPVLGKVTVFDFHAPWCGPCKALDAELRALALAHPEDLAIRRLDVVDEDSEAWRAYLAPGGHSLPHLRVVGRDGTPLWQRTGTPDDLVRALEALLDPSR